MTLHDAAAVTPTRQEQEYLLRVIEAGVRVADSHQFFLWTQGQLQALLPHRVLAAVRCAPDGQPSRIECVHGAVLDDDTLYRLRATQGGLVARIADASLRAGRRHGDGDSEDADRSVLSSFDADLAALGFGNVVVGSTGRLAEGASIVMLFDVPGGAERRHAYFLDLLVPHLHLALMRLPPALRTAAAPARALTPRETVIMDWLRVGKSNREIGQILAISDLTVKNHLQRIYRLLGVSNRAHALARCLDLRLLGP